MSPPQLYGPDGKRLAAGQRGGIAVHVRLRQGRVPAEIVSRLGKRFRVRLVGDGREIVVRPAQLVFGG